MQVNPNIQYNEEDAGLTLDNPVVDPVENIESSDAQDEADLITAENEQKEITIDKSKTTSSLMQFIESHKNDRLYTVSCVSAGVISVVAVYFLAVFM